MNDYWWFVALMCICVVLLVCSVKCALLTVISNGLLLKGLCAISRIGLFVMKLRLCSCFVTVLCGVVLLMLMITVDLLAVSLSNCCMLDLRDENDLYYSVG